MPNSANNTPLKVDRHAPTGSTQATTARLAFLAHAAESLSPRTPATAAALAAERTRLVDLLNLPVQTPSHSSSIVCRACGAAIVPGSSRRITDEFAVQNRRRGRQVREGSKVVTATPETAVEFTEARLPDSDVVVYECGRCSRRTRVPLVARDEPSVNDSKPRIEGERAEESKIVVSTSAGKTTAAFSKTTSANASSKTRAKARKLGGLKAMLEKSRADAVAKGQGREGGGFGLMDFLTSE